MAQAGRKGQVGDLLVSLRTDLGQLRTDVTEIRKTYDQGFRQIQQSAQVAGLNMQRSLQLATRAAGLFGVGLGAVGLTAFTRNVVNTAAKLKDLSEATNLSIGLLGGFRSVAAQSGTTVEALATAFTAFQRNLGGLTEESVRAREALRRMGISADELRNLLPDQQLEKVAQGLAKLQNPTERAAAAVALLGREGAALIPSLLKIAEDGMPKLDKATENAYKTLGNFKDSLAVGGAGLIDFAAKLIEPHARLIQFTQALINFKNVAKEDQFGILARQIEIFTQHAARATGLVAGKIEGMSNEALAELAKNSTASVKFAVDNLIKARDEFDRISKSLPPLQGPATPTEDKAAAPGAAPAQSADKMLSQFLQTLERQRVGLHAAFLELGEGAGAALAFGLDQEFKALEQRFQDAGLTLPPGARASFDSFKESITATFHAIEDLKRSMQSAADVEARDDQDRQDWLTWPADAAKVQAGIDEITDALHRMQAAAVEAMDDLDLAEIANKAPGVHQEVMRIAGATAEGMAGLKSFFASISKGIEGSLQGVLQGTQSWSDAMKAIFANILASMAAMIAEMLVLEGIKLALQAFTGAAGGGSVPAGAKGGIVPQGLEWKKLQHLNDGGVLMMGHVGEFMQRKAAVDYYGLPFMEAVNQLKIPKLDLGGPIRGPSVPSYQIGGSIAGSHIQGAAGEGRITVIVQGDIIKRSDFMPRGEIVKVVTESEGRAVLRSKAEVMDGRRRGGRFSRILD